MNAGADLNNPQSWGGYSYVMNAPLNAVDPDGMAAENVSTELPPQPAPNLIPTIAFDWLLNLTFGRTLPTFYVEAIGYGAVPTQKAPPKTGTTRGLATCAASNASSFASLLGLPKDNFWAQAFLGNDFSTAANLLLGNNRGTNGRGALLSNPTLSTLRL